MARMATGITANCPCGATDVPIKFGSAHTDMKLRVHAEGVPFSQDYRSGKCGGPVDLFLGLIGDAGLLVIAPGVRYGSLEERAAGDKFIPVDTGMCS